MFSVTPLAPAVRPLVPAQRTSEESSDHNGWEGRVVRPLAVKVTTGANRQTSGVGTSIAPADTCLTPPSRWFQHRPMCAPTTLFQLAQLCMTDANRATH